MTDTFPRKVEIYGFVDVSLLCSITEVQRDVEYRVTFNAGNSTVFLNMYVHSVFCPVQNCIIIFIVFSIIQNEGTEEMPTLRGVY